MPVVKALSVKTQADDVVAVVATEDAKVCDPVPDVRLRAVVEAELPMFIVSAPVPPVPMFIVSAAVAPVPAIFIVWVPDPLPMAILV